MAYLRTVVDDTPVGELYVLDSDSSPDADAALNEVYIVPVKPESFPDAHTRLRKKRYQGREQLAALTDTEQLFQILVRKKL